MNIKMGYQWNLRQLMDDRGMRSTSDLIGPLAERGIHLSRTQVYRLVTGTPQRINLDVLAALCDILECDPGQLVEIVRAPRQVKKAASTTRTEGVGDLAPIRARVERPPTK